MNLNYKKFYRNTLNKKINRGVFYDIINLIKVTMNKKIKNNKNYLFFIDETGDPSLKSINENYPIFLLSGVLISEEDYFIFDKKVKEFKKEMFETEEVILHSRDIRKCEKSFVKLFDLNFKKVFYEKLNQIILETNFKLISSAIFKEKYFKLHGKISDDPYEIVLNFLIEQAYVYKKDIKLDIKIESRGKNEDVSVQRRYSQIYDRGTGLVSSVDLQKSIPTALEFRKKYQNDNGIQLADLCAYPVARNMLYPAEPYPSFNILKDKIHSTQISPAVN